MKLYTFPESEWAVFSAKGALPGSLQRLNTAVWQEWYPNEGKQYISGGNSMLEVYSPGDMQSPDYECGIWMPVTKRKGESDMNCTIRPWRLTDAKDLASALSNRNILKNLRDGLPYPYTEKDAGDYINAMLTADPQDTFAYAVCVDNHAVGSIGAFRQGNIHCRTAELGYYLAEEYWGRGIMTDAVRQLCQKLFAETDLLRIYAEPFACNIGSRRVLEKADFQLEGILQSNAVKNGQVQDMAIYALVKK